MHAHTPSQLSMSMKSYTTPLHNRIFLISRDRPEIPYLICPVTPLCMCVCVYSKLTIGNLCQPPTVLKTQTCIPNTYAIPLLAPAYNRQICPLRSEAWEIRTRPLGCSVSSITALACLVSVLTTLLVGLVVFLIVVGVGRLRTYHAQQEDEGWWKVWEHYWPHFLDVVPVCISLTSWREWWMRGKLEDERDGEEDPLLDELLN